MDIHIRSKLKDAGLLTNPFHLYCWLDDNRDLCRRHGAPNKMKMDGRNHDSTVLEDSRGVALPIRDAMSTNDDYEDIFNEDFELTNSQKNPQYGTLSSPTQAFEADTSLTRSCSDIDALAAHVSKLQSLLTTKEAENNKIANENRLLELKCKKIQREKDILESYTERTLARKENMHQMELHEYKTQICEQQNKIVDILAANDELKSLLAKQQAEKDQIVIENSELQSKLRQVKREMEMLHTSSQRENVKNQGKHRGVLQECNVQVRQKQDKICALDRRNRK